MPRLAFVAFACAATVPLAAQPARPISPPSFDAQALRLVDSIAEAEFRKDSLGSFTVGVVSGRDLVWTKSYGYVDRAKQQLATPSTVYRIASVTKQVTAIMLLQLSDKRVVNLSDPVARHFPEIRRVRGARSDRSPTLLQLATMTSGLARDPNDRRRWQAGPIDRWLETLVSALPSTEYVSEPGTAYRYSNVGFAILGAALGRASGSGYVGYVRSRILRPLGMTSTDFTLSGDMRQRLATGVDYDELYKDTLNYEDAAKDHVTGLGISVPSGGLYSTVGDVAKLVALQIGFGPDTVLSAAAIARRDSVPIVAPRALLRVRVGRSGAAMGRHHRARTFRQSRGIYVPGGVQPRQKVRCHRAPERRGRTCRCGATRGSRIPEAALYAAEVAPFHSDNSLEIS